MSLTLSGSSIAVRAEQPSKALCPIFLMVPGSMMLLSFVQFQNQLAPT